MNTVNNSFHRINFCGFATSNHFSRLVTHNFQAANDVPFFGVVVNTAYMWIIHQAWAADGTCDNIVRVYTQTNCLSDYWHAHMQVWFLDNLIVTILFFWFLVLVNELQHITWWCFTNGIPSYSLICTIPLLASALYDYLVIPCAIFQFYQGPN